MSHDSGRTVSFTFKTVAEKQEYDEYAASKGMTLSVLSKMALFQYRAKYPVKTSSKATARKLPEEAKTVQFLEAGRVQEDGQ
jgi:hypothetical protein